MIMHVLDTTFRRAGRPRAAGRRALLAGAALWAALALPGRAGVISMQVTCSVTADRLTVRFVNSGDEAAQNVRASVSFRGQELTTDAVALLPPGKPQTQAFAINTRDLNGTYPAIVVVDFEDLNAYPFSSVTIQSVRGAGARTSPLVGAMGKSTFSGKTAIPFSIRNAGQRDVTAACRLVTPRELVADEPEFTVTVPAGQIVERKVRLRNFAGTPNSGYPLHCVMEHDEDGFRFCAVATTSVLVTAPSPASSRGFWVVVGAVVAVGVVLILFVLWPKKAAARPQAPPAAGRR